MSARRVQRHDLDAIMAHFADDACSSPARPDRGDAASAGRNTSVAVSSATFEASPDVHYDDDVHFVCESSGVSEWTISGTTVDGERIDVSRRELWTFVRRNIVRKRQLLTIRYRRAARQAHYRSIVVRPSRSARSTTAIATARSWIASPVESKRRDLVGATAARPRRPRARRRAAVTSSLGDAVRPRPRARARRRGSPAPSRRRTCAFARARPRRSRPSPGRRRPSGSRAGPAASEPSREQHLVAGRDRDERGPRRAPPRATPATVAPSSLAARRRARARRRPRSTTSRPRARNVRAAARPLTPAPITAAVAASGAPERLRREHRRRARPERGHRARVEHRLELARLGVRERARAPLTVGSPRAGLPGNDVTHLSSAWPPPSAGIARKSPAG